MKEGKKKKGNKGEEDKKKKKQKSSKAEPVLSQIAAMLPVPQEVSTYSSLFQCSGSMTLWCGSGSGSADPYR
jgi:hypothetical protein